MGRSHVRTRRDADPGAYGLDLETLERPFDPRRLFDRAPTEAPVEVEIGSGKGSFLVAESELRPDTLFVGVERARRYWLYAADRLRRRERSNARIVRGDAREALEAMPAGSVTGLHLYFPDPWPKRRHAHRRLLIQPDFLAACERVLAAGAPLRVVTDAPRLLHSDRRGAGGAAEAGPPQLRTAGLRERGRTRGIQLRAEVPAGRPPDPGCPGGALSGRRRRSRGRTGLRRTAAAPRRRPGR